MKLFVVASLCQVTQFSQADKRTPLKPIFKCQSAEMTTECRSKYSKSFKAKQKADICKEANVGCN
ncbi:MAG: hypothetical protein H7328_08445 [Bdellovibrio sp.]|nr:hypothetical protein [Bdellovibrio sp.]